MYAQYANRIMKVVKELDESILAVSYIFYADDTTLIADSEAKPEPTQCCWSSVLQ